MLTDFVEGVTVALYTSSNIPLGGTPIRYQLRRTRKARPSSLTTVDSYPPYNSLHVTPEAGSVLKVLEESPV